MLCSGLQRAWLLGALLACAAAAGPGRQVLLVRVPRTASDTVEESLTAWRRQGLCDVTVRSVHSPVDQAMRPTAAMLNASDAVVVTHRDPVDRFVSAFNWRHPGHAAHLHYGADAFAFEQQLYACFNSSAELAEALIRADGTRCRQLAKMACSPVPTMPRGRMSMIQAGLASYVGTAGVAAFRSRPLLMTRVERLSDDLHRLFDWLGCDRARLPTLGLPVRSRHRMPMTQNMSRDGRHALRTALKLDYESATRLLLPLSPPACMGHNCRSDAGDPSPRAP